VHSPKAWANPLPAKMHLKQLAIVCATNGIMTTSKLGEAAKDDWQQLQAVRYELPMSI